MRKINSLFFLLVSSISFVSVGSELSCISINSDLPNIVSLAESGKYRQRLKQTSTTFDYSQSHSYQAYLQFARKLITQENPKSTLDCPINTYVTNSLYPQKKLTVADLIAPFELNATNSKKAILLIHGLTDSPYLFHDLARSFHAKGLTVRTLLLPGHGTAAEALVDIDYSEWQRAAAYAITRTIQDFDTVYLGGFSTGGTLVLDNLMSYPKNAEHVNGVFLWAPASKAKSKFAWAAGIADWIPFLDYAHKGADIDFAKYESFPLNAGAQVHYLMNNLRNNVEALEHIPDVPLITFTSEFDTTIDTNETLKLLSAWHGANNRKTKPLDTLFYFGNKLNGDTLPSSYNVVYPSCQQQAYCQHILNVAHTAVTNAPSNPHYGWSGSYRNCETSFGTEHYATCKQAALPTLGETTSENIKSTPSLQRLTFNPNFDQMEVEIAKFLSKTL